MCKISVGDMSLWYNYIYSGLEEDTNTPFVRAVFLTNGFSLLAFLTLVAFGFVYIFIIKNYAIAGFYFVCSFILISNIIVLRYTKRVDIAKHILSFTVLGVLLVQLITGGILNTGIFWFFVFPAAIFYLMGHIYGAVWILLLYAGSLFIVILSVFNYIAVSYPLGTIRQLLISLTVVSIIGYLAEKNRDENERIVYKRSRELMYSNKKLNLEVNERKRAEIALRARTYELKRVNKILKKIDKTKTEFISLASHQLRTPLSAIRWYAGMILKDEKKNLNERQSKYVNEIYEANKRLIGLVNALLNISRVELGSFSIEPESTDIIKVAHSVVGAMSPHIEEKQLHIEEVYDPDVPIIQADPELIRIIYENLLSNAVKYTPSSGTVRIEITLVKKARPAMVTRKNDILILVSDTGYGIPKDDQEKIFTKLFRADNVKMREIEGSGLGLYLVKSIIDNIGGTIWFESEENKGTRFYVTIPVTGMRKKKGAKRLHITPIK